MSSSFDFSKNKIPAKLQQNQSSTKSSLGDLEYDDKRGESVTQLKTQEKANQSSNVGHFSELENLANESQKVTQLMDLQKKTSKNPQQYEPIQKEENKTGLPENLKSGVEILSGHSMDDVKVHHNSDKPAQLQAAAYAQGTDIHLGPGQEKYLPHEAWHVAQQKQGRVEPTTQLKGNVNVNDDARLEKEADVMGDKASSLVQGKSSDQKDTRQLKSSSEGVVQKMVSEKISDDAVAKRQAASKAKSRDPGDEPGYMAGVREHTQHGTKKATVLQKLGHFFKSIGGKEGMDRTLYDGLLQAKKIHNDAMALINSNGSPTINTMLKVIVKMTELNDLGSKVKGKVFASNIEPREECLSNLMVFNRLFIDPKKYIPIDKLEEHAAHFKNGAAKIDRTDVLGGFEFDWGKVHLGERGAQFFGPLEKAQQNLAEADAKTGLIELKNILKLDDTFNGWLDAGLFPGPDAKEGATENKGTGTNPKHSVYLITVPGNVMKDKELQELFSAQIPSGKQVGSWGHQWVAGGMVPVIENEKLFVEGTVEHDPKTKEITSGSRIQGITEKMLEGTPEIVIKPLSQEHFLAQCKASKIEPKEISLYKSTEAERQRQINEKKK